MKQNQAEKGIAHIGLILGAIFVLIAVALGGWYVWQQNGSNSNPTDNSQTSSSSKAETKDDVAENDETKNWVSTTTQGGAFSMKVPDGWKLTRYPVDYLGALEITHSSGIPAVIDTSAEEYFGHSLRFRASITPVDDAGLKPQWSSPQTGLEETTQDFSIGTLTGKRHKGVFEEGLNQTIYEYIFLVDNKKLDVVYTIYHDKGEKNDVLTVEKAIKTIQIN